MLLSLTDRVTFFLHPDYVAAVKQTGILRRRIKDKEFIALESSIANPNYIHVVEALSQLLIKPEWQACNAQIVLSGHFTKFRIVKWNDELSQEEHKTLILHQLEEIYGVSESKSHVFMSDSGFKKSSLVFVLEEGFYYALLNLEKKKLFKLNSIVPNFVLITNYWRKLINKTSWLVIKDSEHIYFSKIKDNSWEMIKVALIKNSWEQDVEKTLQRDLMQLGEQTEMAQIYFHEEKKSSFNLNSIKGTNTNVVKLVKSTHDENDAKFQFANYLP